MRYVLGVLALITAATLIFRVRHRIRDAEARAQKPKLKPIPFSDKPELIGTGKGLAGYQTKPLTAYSPAHQHLAEDAFEYGRALLRGRHCRRYKGSYSFLDEHHTTGKIVIYEHGVGKPCGAFPDLQEGVYLLVRASSDATTETLGIAPCFEERFTYRPMTVANFKSELEQALGSS